MGGGWLALHHSHWFFAVTLQAVCSWYSVLYQHTVPVQVPVQHVGNECNMLSTLVYTDLLMSTHKAPKMDM